MSVRVAARRGTVTRAEYEALLERLEDIEDALRLREAEPADRSDYMPAELVRRMVEGESPVRVWREHRGLSLKALAEKAGVRAGYLSEIENRKKPGSVAAFRALARALGVAVDDLL